MNADNTYIELVKKILKENKFKNDRTGTGIYYTFGETLKFENIQNEFPLLTTKKIKFSSIVHELLWMLSGSTNILPLLKNDVHIWSEWPWVHYKKQTGNEISLKEFEYNLLNGLIDEKWGDLGPVYGAQWRNFNGIDQIQKAIDMIIHNPDSRRIIISAWNPGELAQMLLEPCHTFIQFDVFDNILNCMIYLRSNDIFLGAPFNIAQYALLTIIMAWVTNTIPGTLIYNIGNAHIYTNHLNQLNKQINNHPFPSPTLSLSPDTPKDINLIKPEHIELLNYTSHSFIKAPVAI